MEMGENQEKYILYETINIVNNKIYIGVHKIIQDKFDGYLGCGIYTNKPSSYLLSRTPFQRAVCKYGPSKFKRTTIKEFTTLEDALNLEKEIVNLDFIKREDTYNITIGGGYPPPEAKVKVYRYTLNGEFDKAYNSIQEASKDTVGLKSINIARACKNKNKTQVGGYMWSYDKLEKLEQYQPYNKPRKVAQCLLSGEIVKIYDTVRACKKDFCGCVHVLNGKRKQCKGYTFKYID